MNNHTLIFRLALDVLIVLVLLGIGFLFINQRLEHKLEMALYQMQDQTAECLEVCGDQDYLGHLDAGMTEEYYSAPILELDNTDYQSAPETVSGCFTGAGTAQHPYLVMNCDCLQKVGRDGTTMHDTFALAHDLNCEMTSEWDDGAGFRPVGSEHNGFRGTFDGRGHTISNLYINRPENHRTGLFARTESKSIIKNLKLDNADVTGHDYTAALTGDSHGNIERVSVTRSKVNAGGVAVGMIAGSQRGNTVDSYVTGHVTGGGWTGGMIGTNFGIVERAYANVRVNGSNQTGGLLGDTNDSVRNSFSVGTVTGSGRGNTGAFIGWTNTGDYNNLDNSFYTRQGNLIEGIGTTNHIPTTPYRQHNVQFFHDGDNFPSWDRNRVWFFSGSKLPVLR